MEREQHELRFLGFFGIIKESSKIIFTWRKIFSQITLALTFPLSLIFLAHVQISQLLFFRIFRHELTLDDTSVGTPSYHRLSRALSSEWALFWLFNASYFTFLLILSLLSTAAVVYTIACMYTAKPVTFRKVMSVVPRVWKRLMVTFLWSFGLVLAYNVVSAGVLVLWGVSLGNEGVIGIVVLVLLLILYLVGFMSITIIWHLASVVSVLEETYGIKAMIKSKNLIKGKVGVSVTIFVSLGLCLLAIQFMYQSLVVLGLPEIDLGIRIGIGILCFLLLFQVILYGFVLQTVLYFVCKSYHHQNIDKSLLADHLDNYLGDYVRLSSGAVQMEQV
ncbi:hypothetical protein K2173_012043 [Erythroxylum novogranatense]|uniref:Uncharacterized protein n=1 Tax=Erythroxylum novogranatense TaxID=1862640 RepID=A0AAV8TG17_9ROSI|nr:hypothetical protein K2173_012043 [Erythroxylum novogranatense]